MNPPARAKTCLIGVAMLPPSVRLVCFTFGVLHTTTDHLVGEEVRARRGHPRSKCPFSIGTL
jgi:hypothetical protein